MKDKITISLNPSYFCNLRCEFCYLSDAQLSDIKTTPIDVLLERFSDVSRYRLIDHVDLYGGEIGLLKADYLADVIKVVRLFYQEKINVITNLTIVNQAFLTDDFDLSVSWDYTAREHHEKVYKNMLNLKKDFHVLILASDKLVNLPETELDEFIRLLNALPHLRSVEIKPFSNNQYNAQAVNYIEHEAWIKKWLARSKAFKFEFINKAKIEDSLAKRYSSWSDEHLYLTPAGKYAVLEFDKENKEFFMELESFQDYEKWMSKEREIISNNPYCGQCEYLGHCLSEHLQPVYDISKSCNGFRNLLSWYKEKR